MAGKRTVTIESFPCRVEGWLNVWGEFKPFYSLIPRCGENLLSLQNDTVWSSRYIYTSIHQVLLIFNKSYVMNFWKTSHVTHSCTFQGLFSLKFWSFIDRVSTMKPFVCARSSGNNTTRRLTIAVVDCTVNLATCLLHLRLITRWLHPWSAAHPCKVHPTCSFRCYVDTLRGGLSRFLSAVRLQCKAHATIYQIEQYGTYHLFHVGYLHVIGM